MAAVDAAATTAAAGCQRVTRCPTGRPTPPVKKAGKTKKGRKNDQFWILGTANYDDECTGTNIDAAAGMKLAGHGKGVQKSSWEIVERHNTAEIVLIASNAEERRGVFFAHPHKILSS